MDKQKDEIKANCHFKDTDECQYCGRLEVCYRCYKDNPALNRKKVQKDEHGKTNQTE